MAVTIGNRLSCPSDWTEIEPGEWHVEHDIKSSMGPIHVTTVGFGNSQCVICGEPMQRTPGECDKCNECWHTLQRYKPVQDDTAFENHTIPPASWAG